MDWPLVIAIAGQLKDPDPAWWAGLPSITARTLIIAGGEDSHVPQDLLAEAAQLIPDATLVRIPAGHRVHTSRPAEFTAAVLGFLRAGWRPSGPGVAPGGRGQPPLRSLLTNAIMPSK